MAAGKRPSVRGAVLEYLDLRKPEQVGRAELQEIRQHAMRQVERTKPVSDRYLLSILLETSVEIDQAIGGLPPDLRAKIPVKDLAACKQSLVGLAREYGAADPARAGDVRRAVRRTKDHLELALRRTRAPDKLGVQREAMQWLRAWLENPPVFEAWVQARERAQARAGGAAADPPTGS